MDQLFLPNLLVIAGTGRNSGKTTFACGIIKKFCSSYPIVAVKISPHYHDRMPEQPPIYSAGKLYIAEETDDLKPKDSSRMLAAGARKSFFVMAGEEQLKSAFKLVFSLIDASDFIVCESGGLRNVVTPGLFLMMNRNDNHDLKPGSIKFKSLCDLWITFDGKQCNFTADSIEIHNKQWQLVENLAG